MEVGLQPGGRQVTIQSAFSLLNRMDYAVIVELSPFGKLKSADDEGVKVEPGETFHLPPLLLDCSLRSLGTELGFVYVRPQLSKQEIEDIFPSDIAGDKGVEAKVGRCSRPINLNHVIIFGDFRCLSRSRCSSRRSNHLHTNIMPRCRVERSWVYSILHDSRN